MTQIAATAPVVAQPINPTRLFGKIALPGALQRASDGRPGLRMTL